MITFTPLSGAARESRTTPLCYILQIDDVKILIDCGSPDWSPEPSPFEPVQEIVDETPPWKEYCEALQNVAPSIDLVLVSHGDLAHCGLYPWAYSKWGLRAPAYTTLPVQAMGRIAVTEDVEGLRDERDFGDEEDMEQEDTLQEEKTDEEPMESEEPPVKNSARGQYIPTVIEVQDAFDAMNTLRYSQPTHLQGKCQGLTITPFNAGHTLGGTIWKIRSPSSGTIVYAVNVNHMRERHLDGTVLIRQSAGGIFEPLARPDLLITDADRAPVITSRRKVRDAALIDTITTTLSENRSSILLPCDASTRILELLVLLDQHWNYSRLRYPICLLSRTGREMLTFVRSMMEWLGGTISKEDVGEDGTNNRKNASKRKRDDDGEEDALGAFALRFQHLEFFNSPQALLQTYSSKDPKLILAVPASLSHGPSRNLFQDFAAISDNVILLTSRGDEGTLSRALFDKWNGSQRPEDKWDQGKIGRNVMMEGSIKLKMHKKVPLSGVELEIYQQREKEKKEKEVAHQAALLRTQRLLEADEGDTDSDSDSDDTDAEEEDEVRNALGGDLMDTSEEGVGNKKKRKGGKDLETADWLDGDEGLTKQMLSFDIYLKGNVAKSTSFFKNASQGPRFRMFPYVEKRRRVDDYGETIDVGMWLRKGKALEEEAESEEMKDLKKKAAEEEAKKAINEVPSKFISNEVEIQLACRLLFIDMEGLNDGRAVKTIIPQVNPRKMILVQARPEATDSLIDACSNIRSMTKGIFAPGVGETIQIGQQTSSFSLNISDELLASLHISKFEDNEISYVRGRVTTHATSTIPTLEPISTVALKATTPNVLPTLGERSLASRPPVPLPNSTMIGELRLTALKSRLVKIGLKADLIGEGVLMCGTEGSEHSVAVRKLAKGKLELEGNVSDVYYTVRQEIYNLHALVAAV
ncbi:beta-lactamase-like protein, partial [Crepidotus variabilis]